MSTDTEVLQHCFEEVAKSDTDISAAVYEKFTADMPGATQHIGIMDSRMRGRMLEQIYNLLLGEVDHSYLEFEARMHRGYGADEGFYRGILNAIKDAVSDVLGEAWSEKEMVAWDRSIEQLVTDIKQLNHIH